jgi:NADH:ubiquinone oxidoreductase subunit 5 (subunit L)/multisubunit Na+/H+ antiporter MnhA subunit
LWTEIKWKTEKFFTVLSLMAMSFHFFILSNEFVLRKLSWGIYKSL